MQPERLVPRGTTESRRLTERVVVALELTSTLNRLPFSDEAGRSAILAELMGRPVPATLRLLPPFFCDHGLSIRFGDRVFVNQNCSFHDMGGIEIGDRTMVGPGVTLLTAGHPVPPGERGDGITVAPIRIGADVWIGAAATVLPGVTVGDGAVIGAGAVIGQDVEPRTLVTGGHQVVRRRLD